MLIHFAYALAITLGLARLLCGCGPHEAILHDPASQPAQMAPDGQEQVGEGDELREPWELLYTGFDALSAAPGVKPAGGGGHFCLDAKDHSKEPGTLIQLWECAGSDNQAFTYTGDTVRVFGNMCLAVAGARDRDGTSVRIKPCEANKISQVWHTQRGMLRWGDSQKCLDVLDGRFENGTLLQIWTCQPGSENQTFAVAAAASVSKPSSGQQPVAVKPHGTRLDVSKWRQETYRKGMFNHEEERYTDKNQNVAFNADGSFTITARKDGNGEWTSARLTGDEVGKLPAYYEATISLPSAKGTWPAFWLTSRGAWPQGGEIDIMEQVNGDGKTHWSNHWGASSGKPTFNTHESMGGLDLSKPHSYGGYITAKGVQFYVDGKAVGKWVTYPAESNFPHIASQMVPIVNLAMGGDWPGKIPESVGPQKMVVHAITKADGPPQL